MSAFLSHGFLYVVDVERMAAFYTAVFGFHVGVAKAGWVHLEHAGGAGLALHAVPPGYARAIADPPVWREDVAQKLCYRTDDVPAVLASVVAKGGQVKDPWEAEGTAYCTCADPEGNVFQVIGPDFT